MLLMSDIFFSPIFFEQGRKTRSFACLFQGSVCDKMIFVRVSCFGYSPVAYPNRGLAHWNSNAHITNLAPLPMSMNSAVLFHSTR